jgi:hypothetical protein
MDLLRDLGVERGRGGSASKACLRRRARSISIGGTTEAAPEGSRRGALRTGEPQPEASGLRKVRAGVSEAR